MSTAESQKGVEQAPRTGYDWDLPGITVASHGINPQDADILATQSFATEEQVLPEPYGDIYLNGTVLPITGRQQTAVVFTQPPGVLEWHRAHTMSPCAKVIEIPLVPGAEGQIGYPFGDINTRLADEVELNPGIIQRNGKPIVWTTTFPGASSRVAARRIGAEMIQTSQPEQTNNKPAFRGWAYEHGLTVAPGVTIRTEEDAEFAAQYLSKLPYGAWMKANGSGGDLVQRIKDVSPTSIASAREALLHEIEKAFDAGKFTPDTRAAYMEPGAFAPVDGFAIEADVRNYGEPIANCSNLVRVDKSGEIEVFGLYGQMTSPDGGYIGSRSLFDLSQVQQFMRSRGISQSELETMITEQSIRAAQYQVEQNHFGFHGQDFFLTQGADGSIMIPMIELNGRLPISGIGELMKRRAGVNHFINTNIWAPGQLNTMDELRTALTLDGQDLTEADPAHGAIHLQAMRSMWTGTNGDRRVVTQSNTAKVLFLGNDPEYLDYLQGALAQKNGISYTPIS